jgi:plastocyanin
MAFGTLVLITSLALQAGAATVKIDVGSQGLSFSPNPATAKVGDVLEFHFLSTTPHSVVQGDFKTPCKPLASRTPFYSGVLAASSDTQVWTNSWGRQDGMQSG